MTVTAAPLARRLGTPAAVVIGLASMIGAGVFSAFAPAASAAGPWLLAGLAIAAIVAYANATSSARLAARYPVSGGTYVYGRERLGAWWGFAAGWSFVVGKTASCAAMAITFAAYAVPEPWQKPVAVAAVLVVTAVDLLGVTKTAGLAAVIVSVVLVALVVIVAGGWLGVAAHGPVEWGAATAGPYGVLQSAGILFFAFAGYARIATLGEEVRSPARTIPRAIGIALAITLVVYAIVAVTTLAAIGPERLARATAPLALVLESGPWGALGPVVTVGAAAASLGALLSLLAGVSRTTLAMAREGDLPRPLAAVSTRFSVPWLAQLVLAAAVVILVLLTDLRSAIGFSSFGVLLYYAVANLSAASLGRRAVPIVGLTGCLTLAATLPWPSVVAGIVVVGVGLAYRAIRIAAAARSRPPRTPPA